MVPPLQGVAGAFLSGQQKKRRNRTAGAECVKNEKGGPFPHWVT